ncbi:hypothetical protein GQ53DRAFT_508114 [Thozetella sp. PMI_491]|nr:hypothetical protein GQ53DRAFT_508114 [Thozetella sp. PMI_491]
MPPTAFVIHGCLSMVVGGSGDVSKNCLFWLAGSSGSIRMLLPTQLTGSGVTKREARWRGNPMTYRKDTYLA